MPKVFEDCYVVGMHHRGADAAQAKAIVLLFDEMLKKSSSIDNHGLHHLSLEREPDNEYDAYAIKVLCDGLHIGYINRAAIGVSEGSSMWVGPFMDETNLQPHITLTRVEAIGKNLYPVLTLTFADE